MVRPDLVRVPTPSPSALRLINADVRMAYQPIVSVAKGAVVGYEALARFGSRGQRGPAQHLAAAQAGGMQIALETRLLAHALAERHLLPEGCWLAVNLSPSAVGDPRVESVMRTAGDLHGVVVELTEESPADDLKVLNGKLDRYREQGAQLALDDAGAGSSGLRQVIELRPDIIKLDRTLVMGVDADPARAAMIEALQELTSRLGAQLLAEGVEQYAELETIAQLGVPLTQGFFLGRPTLNHEDIDSDLGQRLVTRCSLRKHVDLMAGQLDASVPTASTRIAARVRAATEPQPNAVVVLDDKNRPCDAEGVGAMHPLSTVEPHIGSTDALRMAMTRPAPWRFDPLACVDRTGGYLGLVWIDKLFLAVIPSPR
jgi:EAL domain-containing protein (putative c-di-GMP-specific phosphodiesterase class I)